MSLKTLEVEIDQGRIIPRAEDTLPERGRALLTILDPPDTDVVPAKTCAELLERWEKIEWLSPEEGEAFANDIEAGRASLPPLRSKWD